MTVEKITKNLCLTALPFSSTNRASFFNFFFLLIWKKMLGDIHIPPVEFYSTFGNIS